MLNANGKLTRKLDRTISTRARGTEFAEAVRKQLIKGEKQHIKGKERELTEKCNSNTRFIGY
jgi:hypothetical protein